MLRQPHREFLCERIQSEYTLLRTEGKPLPRQPLPQTILARPPPLRNRRGHEAAEFHSLPPNFPAFQYSSVALSRIRASFFVLRIVAFSPRPHHERLSCAGKKSRNRLILAL